MRRAELLRIVGIPTTTYSALSNRGLLPFNDKASGGRWNTFVEEHAIRLALLIDLTRAGMTQSHAALLVRDHFDDLIRLSEELGDGEKPRFMFGAATFVSAADASDKALVPIVAAHGGLDPALQEAADQVSRKGACAPVAIVLVDVSATMEQVYRRASHEELNMFEMREWARFLGLRK